MKPTLDRESLSRCASKLAELSQRVLFDDIWARPQLSPRDRII